MSVQSTSNIQNPSNNHTKAHRRSKRQPRILSATIVHQHLSLTVALKRSHGLLRQGWSTPPLPLPLPPPRQDAFLHRHRWLGLPEWYTRGYSGLLIQLLMASRNAGADAPAIWPGAPQIPRQNFKGIPNGLKVNGPHPVYTSLISLQACFWRRGHCCKALCAVPSSDGVCPCQHLLTCWLGY